MTGTEMTAAPHRVSFFFSAGGRRAAFLRDNGAAGLGVETWAWRAGAPRRHVLSMHGESLYSQPLPAGDGSALLLRPGAGVHDLVLVGSNQGERLVGRVESRCLFLLPSPAAGTLAVARGDRGDGTAALWVVGAVDRGVEQVPLRGLPPGPLSGGHWLDCRGRTVAFTSQADGQSRIVAVDLATGDVDLDRFAPPRLAGTSRHADRYLLLSHPRSGRCLTAEDNGAERRLCWGAPGRGMSELPFPAEFSAGDWSVTPLAIGPDADAVAFRVERGFRSEVIRLVAGNRTADRVPLPAGQVLPAASWTPAGLHLVTSRPDQPANVTTWPAATSRPTAHADPAPARGWATAHVETLAGPAGPIEAMIYGGPAWRDADQLVVALHGGPHAAWQLAFDPLLQDLAAAGIAVVAPNQRGSAGRGREHRDAIRGTWGGPDLADILHLARALTGRRGLRALPRLMLLGSSYGAFLALLAAAAEPGLWSRCAAMSPFAAAESLGESGRAATGSFLRRLDAQGMADDPLGPRDLGRLGGRITARVFIAHGTGDERIPLSEPRRIVAALEQAGRRPGADYVFREEPGGHDLGYGRVGAALRHALVEFLTGGDTATPVAGRTQVTAC